MIFERNASIARFTQDNSNSNKESYASVDGLGNIPINIQPASTELIAVTDGAFGQTFRAFTSVSGIKIGDRVTVSGTLDKFIVKGVDDWYYAPIPHLELLLFKSDE